MKRRQKWIWAALCSVFLTGCGRQMVSVADIASDASGQSDYIEINEFELKEEEETTGREEVSYCAVLIPASYQESEEVSGMYVHEKNPLDSSNIYYTVSQGDGEGAVSEELTKEAYEEILEEAYRRDGQEVDLVVESFEEIDMEGVPGYKIRSSYQIEEGAVEQLTYLILAQDTYTITYSQMSDDELMADFEISDGEIRLVREEEVSLARNAQE